MKELALSLFTFLGHSSDTFVDAFFNEAHEVHIDAGKQVFLEGEHCSGGAFVLEGRVRVYKSSDSGREVTLYEVLPGETCILNASCILSDSHYPANSVADTDVHALLIPANHYLRWVDQEHAFRMFVFDLITRRMSEVLLLLEEVMFQKMDKRIADYLLRESVRNGLQQRSVKATHEDIAGELGTAREVVSRILKDFEKRGFVQLGRGTVTILNRDALDNAERSLQ